MLAAIWSASCDCSRAMRRHTRCWVFSPTRRAIAILRWSTSPAAPDPPGALETLQRAIRRYPRVERLYLQLAELCNEHGSYDLGVEVVDLGINNIPGSHRILTMRGILLAELGRYDEAEAAFLAAAEADSDAQSAALGLSLTLQKSGRIDESIDVLRERVGKSPADAVARLFCSQALVKQAVEPGSAEFQEALEGLLLAADRLPGSSASRRTRQALLASQAARAGDRGLGRGLPSRSRRPASHLST